MQQNVIRNVQLKNGIASWLDGLDCSIATNDAARDASTRCHELCVNLLAPELFFFILSHPVYKM